mgnify:CR=1 FL=1
MESNGQKSCGEKSRHTHIRYFFIKDVVKRESIELIHCPTERMIADYYTKPLQGSLFKKMRNVLMGLAPFPDEERVRLSEKVSKKIKTSGTCDEDVSRKTVQMNKEKSSVTDETDKVSTET